MRPQRLPSLASHLALLWGLRLKLLLGALPRGGALVVPMVAVAVLGGVTLAAARASHAVFVSEAVLAEPSLLAFLLLLLGFLAGTTWAAWPVVTATVDDSSELSRFALFPVHPARLFAASIAAALVEPRTLPVWGALLGAGFALHENLGVPLPLVVLAAFLLALASVAWGRAWLHVLLHVLRHRRSAEAMGAGLLVALFGAALVPPPDLSWLKDVASGTPTVDSRLLAGATALFSLLPTGGYAWTQLGAAQGWWGVVALAVAYPLIAIVSGLALAYVLLVRFHRSAGRALPRSGIEGSAPRAFSDGSMLALFVERELRDIARNPRARLMVALPFFLAILVKLVGGRALAEALVGDRADAWLLGGIVSYGALVFGAGFAQNAFGYDGHGASALLVAPVPLRTVIVAKNIVHGGLALVLSTALGLFYALYVGMPAGWTVLLVAANALWQTGLLVGMGNVLSVLLPRRFHASLRRRDRPPPASIAAGLGAAAIAVLPGSWLLRSGTAPSGVVLGLVALLLPVAGFVAWRVSLDVSLGLLATRRAALLRAVARE